MWDAGCGLFQAVGKASQVKTRRGTYQKMLTRAVTCAQKMSSSLSRRLTGGQGTPHGIRGQGFHTSLPAACTHKCLVSCGQAIIPPSLSNGRIRLLHCQHTWQVRLGFKCSRPKPHLKPWSSIKLGTPTSLSWLAFPKHGTKERRLVATWRRLVRQKALKAGLRDPLGPFPLALLRWSYPTLRLDVGMS